MIETQLSDQLNDHMTEVPRNFDVIVLGGGIVGITAAIEAGRAGYRTAIVAGEFGGRYLSEAIPAGFYHENARFIRHAMRYRGHTGIVVGKVSLDMHRLILEKEEVMNQEAAKLRKQIEDAGVYFFSGAGRPLPNGMIDVKEEDGNLVRLTWKRLIVATGMKAQKRETLKHYTEVVEDDGIYRFNQIPEEMTILGDGVRACEVASLFQTLGSHVSIVTDSSSVLKHLDTQIVGRLEEQMKRRGTKIFLKMRPVDIYKDSLKMTHIELASADAFAASEKAGGHPKTEHTVISSSIYVPTLYKGNMSGLSPLRLDIDDGFVVTDSFYRTSLKNVYAVGSVTGQCQMAYEGRMQAKTLIENLVAEDQGRPRQMLDVYQMPHFIHTFPEVASVGLTTQEASIEHEDIRVGLAPLGDEPGSLFASNKQGFVKVIVDGKYREILGVHIIGENACEFIAQVQALMIMEGTTMDLSRIVHPIPSLSLALEEAFDQIEQ
jgi:dihydrolipoamide dehydrogenase